jgi:hypothetical protein
MIMSTPLPMTHDCCWARSGGSSFHPTSDFVAAIVCPAVRLWRAFAHWQARRLTQRLATFEPNCRWLQSN